MKIKTFWHIITCLLCVFALSPAHAKPHPRAHAAVSPQPNIRNAHEALLAANKDLMQYSLEAKPKHLKSALVRLDTAKTLLDDAKNNKGPYRNLAVKAIEATEEKIKAIEQDANNVNAAKEELKKAIEATSDAGRVGR